MGMFSKLLRVGEGRKVKALESLVPEVNRILADLGADIVKVEHPNGGDRTRIQGRIGDFSTYFGSVNRGNAAALMGATDVDGLLVGGASLEAEGWASIVRT